MMEQTEIAAMVERLREADKPLICGVIPFFETRRRICDAANMIEALSAELHLMKTAGVIEVAVRNPSVMEYVKHWEDRATKADAQLAASEAARMEAEARNPLSAAVMLERAAEACDDVLKFYTKCASTSMEQTAAQIDKERAIGVKYAIQAIRALSTEISDADLDAAALARPKVRDLTMALVAMLQSVCGPTGFAEAVRHNSCRAYPWPSLDKAEEQSRSALAALEVKP